MGRSPAPTMPCGIKMAADNGHGEGAGAQEQESGNVRAESAHSDEYIDGGLGTQELSRVGAAGARPELPP